MRHEEAAVHAADGYFRASGNMAMAICTSGPGATNFVTGLYTAQIDSIPLIAITGQNTTSQLGKEAFQCVDIVDICKTVAKAAYCVKDSAEVVKVMREAFKVARSGRPGPVLIDLPLDIQMKEIEYDPVQDKPLLIDKVLPDMDKIKKAVDMLLEAKNPIIIMGGGVILSGAAKECVEFAEHMSIPVITTYMAKGGIPAKHPLNAGHMGIQVGAPLGNKMFMESDVVLGIGCRFTDRHTGDIKVYTSNRKFIHVDIEPTQIGRIFEPNIGIVSDAKHAIKALIEEVKSRGVNIKPSDRVKGLPELRKKLKRKTYYENVPIKPQRVYYECAKRSLAVLAG